MKDCRLQIDADQAIIDTTFYVDHSEVNSFLEKEEDWHMGPLKDGEEFFAFVFSAVLKQT